MYRPGDTGYSEPARTSLCFQSIIFLRPLKAGVGVIQYQATVVNNHQPTTGPAMLTVPSVSQVPVSVFPVLWLFREMTSALNGLEITRVVLLPVVWSLKSLFRHDLNHTIILMIIAS